LTTLVVECIHKRDDYGEGSSNIGSSII